MFGIRFVGLRSFLANPTYEQNHRVMTNCKQPLVQNFVHIAIRHKKARILAGFVIMVARQNSSVTQPFEAELTVRAYL